MRRKDEGQRCGLEQNLCHTRTPNRVSQLPKLTLGRGDPNPEHSNGTCLDQAIVVGWLNRIKLY